MSRSADVVVVGLGAMGLPMARNLTATGLTVVGVEPSDQRSAQAVDLTVVRSVHEAPSSRVVVVMVASVEQLASVVDAAVVAGRTEAVWVISATVGAETVIEQAERLRSIGARVVDAPVTGGVPGATAGTLLLFIGGADEDISAVLPELRSFGSPEVVGPRIGDGQKMKMVNQHLCSIHLAAAAEALFYAAQLGLDREHALGLLSRGGAASWMLADRGPRMLQAPQTVNSSVDIFVKDSRLVQELADRSDAPVPILTAAREYFEEAQRRGWGGEDDSQIIAVFANRPPA